MFLNVDLTECAHMYFISTLFTAEVPEKTSSLEEALQIIEIRKESIRTKVSLRKENLLLPVCIS